MRDVSRRRFLASTGAVTATGLAGCSGGDNSGGGGGSSGNASGGGGDGSVSILHPEGVPQYALYEAGLEQGFWQDEGVDLTMDYVPFSRFVQSLSNGEVDVSVISMIPYMSNYLRGEDVVTFGFSGSLQAINGLYTRANSDYQSASDMEGRTVGVWSFGSSTVQSFQAVLAEQTGLQLREDFETTTAAPPALLGLLTDEEIDGVVNLSSLTIQMEAEPDTYRQLISLNNAWQQISGSYLPITSWFASTDWYDQNTETAAGLLRGARRATQYWRENTQSILNEYGEAAGIDTEAKISVVNELANDGQVFQMEPLADSYVESTWQFVELMSESGFIDEVPSQDEILRNPL